MDFAKVILWIVLPGRKVGASQLVSDLHQLCLAVVVAFSSAKGHQELVGLLQGVMRNADKNSLIALFF